MEKDLDSFMSYRNNADWMKYQGFKNLTKSAYRERLIVNVDLNIGTQLAIIKKNTDQLIGDLYLKKQKDQCQLGYTINPSSARSGYIQEVIIGIIAWLKENDVKQLRAEVDAHNIASIKLLKKLGFVYQGLNTEYDDVYTMNI